MIELSGTWLVEGVIDGEIIRLDEPLSFWGGFDAKTGRVIDRSHPQWQEQLEVGEEVLRDLGTDAGKILTVFNKSDRVEAALRTNGDGVRVSALTGLGIDELRTEILERLDPGRYATDSSTSAEAL